MMFSVGEGFDQVCIVDFFQDQSNKEYLMFLGSFTDLDNLAESQKFTNRCKPAVVRVTAVLREAILTHYGLNLKIRKEQLL